MCYGSEDEKDKKIDMMEEALEDILYIREHCDSDTLYEIYKIARETLKKLRNEK